MTNSKIPVTPVLVQLVYLRLVVLLILIMPPLTLIHYVVFNSLNKKNTQHHHHRCAVFIDLRILAVENEINRNEM